MQELPLFPYAPYDPAVDSYCFSRTNLGYGTAVPLEYGGWRQEQVAAMESCYLHAGLNPQPCYRVAGPDALRFFSETCVNGFSNFPVGAMKHAIMCSERGRVMAHGVLLRVAEDEFITTYLAPYAVYRLQTGDYDARGESVDGRFTFQLAGPRSLEVLETAARECLHDVAFGRHRMSAVAGATVRVIRLGMAGTLAYEVNGVMGDAARVYQALVDAGAAFGLEKLGLTAYRMNHTPGGFPQAFVHFPVAWGDDQGFTAWTRANSRGDRPGMRLRGSMGADMEPRYRDPLELGWGKAVKFDHDFTGRAALEQRAAEQRRTMVTLVWDAEDILDVHASQFRPGEPFMPMEPIHEAQEGGVPVLYADRVVRDGALVGVSSGRTYSHHFREMLSLCSLDTESARPGTEVSVVWGDPGMRQREIRATVSRFPYVDRDRNERVDVTTIPCTIDPEGV